MAASSPPFTAVKPYARLSSTATGCSFEHMKAVPSPSSGHPFAALGSFNGLSLISQVVTGEEKAAFPLHEQEALQQSQYLVVTPAEPCRGSTLAWICVVEESAAASSEKVLKEGIVALEKVKNGTVMLQCGRTVVSSHAFYETCRLALMQLPACLLTHDFQIILLPRIA